MRPVPGLRFFCPGHVDRNSEGGEKRWGEEGGEGGRWKGLSW